MKKLKLIFMSLSIAATVFLGNSCNDSGYSLGDVWYSLATVRPLDGAYYLTTDKGTSLWPAATDIHWYKPKEKHRALAFYTILSDEFQGYDHAIKVLSIRDILTKPIAEDKEEENDTYYGNDPVKIIDMWIGDGYLNVEFGFNYGGSVKHFINLLKASDVNTPYAFEFRHNAYHDNAYERRNGIVSFDLSTLETDGQEIELNIRVKTFEGDKDYTVKYQPGTKEPKEIQRNLSDDFVEIE